jgi:hypothetical protein
VRRGAERRDGHGPHCPAGLPLQACCKAQSSTQGSQLCLDCRSIAWQRQPWIPNFMYRIVAIGWPTARYRVDDSLLLPLQACCKAQRQSSQLDGELPCIESSQLAGLGRTTMYRILATTAFGWRYHVSNHRSW